MADSIAAEAARPTSRPLATSDPQLLDVCYDEGISTIVLAASDGFKWVPGTPTALTATRTPRREPRRVQRGHLSRLRWRSTALRIRMCFSVSSSMISTRSGHIV